MNVGLFVQARLNSTRIPKKMLRPIYQDKSILYLSLQAANELAYDKKALLIPYGEKDYFKDVADEFDFPIIEGPEDDVLGRFILGLEAFPNIDLVQRVCADKVIFAKFSQNELLLTAEECMPDLAHYIDDPLRSVTAGIYRAQALVNADIFYPCGKESSWDIQREHIKPLFIENKDLWNIYTRERGERMKEELPINLSLDTEEQIDYMKRIFEEFYKGKPIDFWNIVQWLVKNK